MGELIAVLHCVFVCARVCVCVSSMVSCRHPTSFSSVIFSIVIHHAVCHWPALVHHRAATRPKWHKVKHFHHGRMTVNSNVALDPIIIPDFGFWWLGSEKIGKKTIKWSLSLSSSSLGIEHTLTLSGEEMCLLSSFRTWENVHYTSFAGVGMCHKYSSSEHTSVNTHTVTLDISHCFHLTSPWTLLLFR